MPIYKRVGITAGFEPAGGFAQYVSRMDWIDGTRSGKDSGGIPFEAPRCGTAEHCLKAVVQCDPRPDDFVVVLGQGPIGADLPCCETYRRSPGCHRYHGFAVELAALRTRTSRGSLKMDVRPEPGASPMAAGADLVIVCGICPGIVEQQLPAPAGFAHPFISPKHPLQRDSSFGNLRFVSVSVHSLGVKCLL